MAIVEKVTCPKCKHFIGCIASDGTGPIFDDCAADDPKHRKDCPMYERLRDYQPKRIPLGLGGGSSGPLDEDAGGLYAVARRHMED